MGLRSRIIVSTFLISFFLAVIVGPLSYGTVSGCGGESSGVVLAFSGPTSSCFVFSFSRSFKEPL